MNTFLLKEQHLICADKNCICDFQLASLLIHNGEMRIFTIMPAYKRRKAPQTRRPARLEASDFVEYLVAGAGFEPATFRL